MQAEEAPAVHIVGIGPGAEFDYLTEAAQGVRFVFHPGVGSLQAPLAKLGLEHASAEEGTPMAVYAPGRDTDAEAQARIEGLCSLKIPLAFFLADDALSQILEAGARHFGANGRVVIGHRIGWPDEWTLDTTFDALHRQCSPMVIPRHSLILVGPWNG